MWLILLALIVTPCYALDCDYYFDFKDYSIGIRKEPYLRVPELASLAETRKEKLAFLLAEQGNELFSYLRRTQNERVWYVGEIEPKDLNKDLVFRGKIFVRLRDGREIECIEVIANYDFDINMNPASKMVFLYPQVNRFTFKDVSFDNRGKEVCIFHISFPKVFDEDDVLEFDIRLEDRAEK